MVLLRLKQVLGTEQDQHSILVSTSATHDWFQTRHFEDKQRVIHTMDVDVGRRELINIVSLRGS